MGYKYLFYTEGNRCFAGEFISERPEKEQGKIKYYLDLLALRGPMLREPYAKKLNSDIFELRPGFGNVEIRLFYFWDGDTAWFVSGIVKKSQKTPEREIKLAVERMKRYFAAKGGRI